MAEKKSDKKFRVYDLNMSFEDKEKALGDAIAQIEKTFGKGAIMTLTAGADKSVEAISTGCLTVDLALGIGGLPRGRIIEIYGPESSGKTTLSLSVIAQAQKENGIVAFIDAEHALDPSYASLLGIDLSKLYISQPDTGEQALDITEQLVRSGALDVIVIDSVAALTPKAELDGEIGDSHIGLQARLMSQALRKLASVCNRTKTCIIFINQLREKVGGYGNPEVTPGGKALKFYASVRMDIRKGEPIKQGNEIIGNITKVKVVKNKVAPPFKKAEFDIMFGKGISREGAVIDLAVENDIIHKSGSWFSYNDEKIGQGKEQVKKYLEANAAICDEMEAKIRKLFDEKDGNIVTSAQADEDDSDASEE